ncbi:CLUMA_CG017662, isoform A [Clunio marinus]|uniref:CLUMA_CG017662, isoform A n=1 Tax=Clunio marinus TaxID=568069 RepID=A0A1J1IY00_9DIPT|nr:CLUMA_CG017662, isoform A [Clunio marinus]
MYERGFDFFIYSAHFDILENYPNIQKRVKFINTKKFLDKPLKSSNKAVIMMPLVEVIASNKRHFNDFTHKILKEPMRVDNIVIYFSKHFYLIEAINEKLSQLIASGIIKHWIENFLKLQYRMELKGSREMLLDKNKKVKCQIEVSRRILRILKAA